MVKVLNGANVGRKVCLLGFEKFKTALAKIEGANYTFYWKTELQYGYMVISLGASGRVDEVTMTSPRAPGKFTTHSDYDVDLADLGRVIMEKHREDIEKQRFTIEELKPDKVF